LRGTPGLEGENGGNGEGTVLQPPGKEKAFFPLNTQWILEKGKPSSENREERGRKEVTGEDKEEVNKRLNRPQKQRKKPEDAKRDPTPLKVKRGELAGGIPKY